MIHVRASHVPVATVVIVRNTFPLVSNGATLLHLNERVLPLSYCTPALLTVRVVINVTPSLSANCPLE